MSEDIKLEEITSTESPAEQKQEVPDEWAKLDGKSQERFKKMISLKNEAITKAQQVEDELKRLKSQSVQAPQQVVQTPSLNTPSQDEAIAAKRLKELGFVTEEELKKRQQEDEAQRARERLNDQHSKLKEEYVSQFGDKAPAYDEAEIENAMYKTGIYDPQYHYEKIYENELLQLKLEKLKSKDNPEPTRTKSKISTGQPWTPEALGERLREPNGMEFYKKNKEKIDKMYKDWGGR